MPLFPIVIQRLAFMCIMLTLPSCWIFDNDFDTIYREYNIGWVDGKSNQVICKALTAGGHGGETLIQEYVFAVGHNERFIIAKQHPFNNGVLDTKTTNYFIIDMEQNPYAGQEGIYGPLSKPLFDSMRQQWKIADIKFDKVYPDNP